MEKRVKNRVAVLAATVAVAAPLTLVATQGPAASAAGCEFPTYQYVVTGESVSVWDRPGGRVTSAIGRGYLVNSGIAPDGGGWLVGNAYTPSRDWFDSGYVLREWTSYTGTSFC